MSYLPIIITPLIVVWVVVSQPVPKDFFHYRSNKEFIFNPSTFFLPLPTPGLLQGLSPDIQDSVLLHLYPLICVKSDGSSFPYLIFLYSDLPIHYRYIVSHNLRYSLLFKPQLSKSTWTQKTKVKDEEHLVPIQDSSHGSQSDHINIYLLV